MNPRVSVLQLLSASFRNLLFCFLVNKVMLFNKGQYHQDHGYWNREVKIRLAYLDSIENRSRDRDGHLESCIADDGGISDADDVHDRIGDLDSLGFHQLVDDRHPDVRIVSYGKRCSDHAGPDQKQKRQALAPYGSEIEYIPANDGNEYKQYLNA